MTLGSILCGQRRSIDCRRSPRPVTRRDLRIPRECPTRALVALSLILSPALLAGCIRPEDSCILIAVDRGRSASGLYEFNVTNVKEGPWRFDLVEFEVHEPNGRPIARGSFARPGPNAEVLDVPPAGEVNAGDALRYRGNASDVGGVTLSSPTRGAIGGTVRCG